MKEVRDLTNKKTITRRRPTVGIITSDLKDFIKLLLDHFSEATQLPIVLYDARGSEVWCSCEEYFSPLCGNCKTQPEVWKLCEASHSERALMDYFPSGFGPVVDKCHLGLWNIAFPIVCENVFYGTLLTGQKRLTAKGKEKETSNLFAEKIEQLKRAGVISDETAKHLERSFNKVERIRAFPQEYISRLVTLEERLIEFVQSLLVRIQKMTLLRHEIHLPNMAADGFVCASLKRLERIKDSTRLDKSQQEDLKKAIEEARRARTYSRLFSVTIENICATFDSNELPLNIGRHNILSIIDAAKGLFATIAEDKDAVITEISKENLDVVRIELDKALVMRALINVYQNAVKYSFSGKDAKNPRTIDTTCKNEASFFLIRVVNYGVGILDSELENVWKEGYRGLLSSDRHRTGSGFGLPQIKKIVEAHGGAVTLSSEQKGDDMVNSPYVTTLSIRLPYYQN